jgi:hypothetical protein
MIEIGMSKGKLRTNSRASKSPPAGYHIFKPVPSNNRNWSAVCDYRPTFKLEGLRSYQEALDAVQREFDQGSDNIWWKGDKLKDEAVCYVRAHMAKFPQQSFLVSAIAFIERKDAILKLANELSITPDEVEKIAAHEVYQDVECLPHKSLLTSRD